MVAGDAAGPIACSPFGALSVGVGNHRQPSLRNRRRLDTELHPQPSQQILVIKAVPHQQFIEAAHRRQQAPLDQELTLAPLRPAAKGTQHLRLAGVSGEPLQLGRRRIKALGGPGIGIQLQDQLAGGLGEAKVVGPAKVPTALPLHPQQPQAGIRGEVLAAQGFAAAPIDDQVLVMPGELGHQGGRTPKVVPAIHAHGHDAEAVLAGAPLLQSHRLRASSLAPNHSAANGPPIVRCSRNQGPPRVQCNRIGPPSSALACGASCTSTR